MQPDTMNKLPAYWHRSELRALVRRFVRARRDRHGRQAQRIAAALVRHYQRARRAR